MAAEVPPNEIAILLYNEQIVRSNPREAAIALYETVHPVRRVKGIVGSRPANEMKRVERFIRRRVRIRRAEKNGLTYCATKSPRKGVRTNI